MLGEFDYAHPVFDLAAVAAQAGWPRCRAAQHTWFAGAWTGYGFHEDGLKSGLAVAAALIARCMTARTRSMQPPDAARRSRAAQLCFGQVRHKRLRPAATPSTTAPTSCACRCAAWARHGVGCALFRATAATCCRFTTRDHGDGAHAAGRLDRRAAAARRRDRRRRRNLAADHPRVLGYVFKPVCFWFCHRADGALRAVLCEVNNTFGERHCYLLDTARDIANGGELSARKVFHVSPFCAVAGGYRFRFMRACARGTARRRTHAGPHRPRRRRRRRCCRPAFAAALRAVDQRQRGARLLRAIR